MNEVERHVATLVEKYGARWRRAAREPGAERTLARMAVDRLTALRLVDSTGGGVVPRPAIARFAIATNEERSGDGGDEA